MPVTRKRKRPPRWRSFKPKDWEPVLRDALLASKEYQLTYEDRKALFSLFSELLHRGGRSRGRTRGRKPDAEFWIACEVEQRFKKEYRTKHGKKNVPEETVKKEIERLKNDAAKKFHVSTDQISTDTVLRWIKSGRLPRSD